MRRTRKRSGVGAALAALAALVSGCTAFDISRLTSDDLSGRNNGTPGSTLAQEYLIGELNDEAEGLDPTGTGDEAYTQAFPGGTNILGVIRGRDLAHEYVVVGAHYDGLGTSCRGATPADTICNGATDNATGVAAAMYIARAIAFGRAPRRSVVIALWDREEDGLLGSQHYVQNPLVPLANTVGYVNFDIQGANLLPHLRNTTFAIAAESGGSRFKEIVGDAIGRSPLDTTTFSSIFGQNRSDYVSFLSVNVPSVFFTDATGPCYHTVEDDFGAVDLRKLDKQIQSALRVTRTLANTDSLPSFTSGNPLATYEDLVGFADVVNLAWADRARFSAADQTELGRIRDNANRLVAEGGAAFGSDDFGTLLGDAASAVSLLTHGSCEGFLEPPHQPTGR